MTADAPHDLLSIEGDAGADVAASRVCVRFNA